MHIEASCFDRVLEKHFRVRKELGLTQAAKKKEFYGFEGSDVVVAHEHKQGVGPGLYFRLRDGRVIEVAAQPHDPHPIWYDPTTH
jgi:hypothetical protein